MLGRRLNAADACYNLTQGRNKLMNLPRSDSEPAPAPPVFKVQRLLLAACIVLAPLSITLFVLAWPENPAPVVVNNTVAAPIATSAMAGPTGNTLHLIG